MRILGGEPLLFKKIQKFLLLAEKWNFDIIIFSNINIETKLLKEIFQGLRNTRIRINCNINHGDFYSEREKSRLKTNITFLQSIWIPLIIGYNIYEYKKPTWWLELAKIYNISHFNLKITNSSVWDDLMIDNTDKRLGRFIYEIVEENYKHIYFSISCWLDKSIFTSQQLQFLEETAGMKLRYWCSGNDGKFDINTDGSIFKCYPLQKLFQKKNIHIENIYKNSTSYSEVLLSVQKWFKSDGECTGNKIIKWNITA